MKFPFLLMYRHAGLVAFVLCAGAAVGFGAAFEGYAHTALPLAALGAKAVPHAQAFNLIFFVGPGFLVALVAMRVRGQLPPSAPWRARIGARTVLLSALAFAAQGLLPLNLADLEGPQSALHQTAWMLWWIAFAAGVVLLGLGLNGRDAFKRFTLLAGTLLPAFVLFLPALLPAGIAQRVAFALWLAWAIGAGAWVNRNAASTPGWSPTTPA